MSRLIDADALKKALNEAWEDNVLSTLGDAVNIITNAPTVQREGWVSVPIELIDRFPEINMGNYSDDNVYELNNWGIEVIQAIQAAPTDTEK